MATQLKDGSFSACHLPENRADPHRIFAEPRQTPPVNHDPTRRCWMLTCGHDVVSVLCHGQFVSRCPMQPAPITAAATIWLYSILAQQMLFWDGEGHLRLQQVLPSIEGGLENLPMDMQAQASVDIVCNFAILPVKVTFNTLGVPREDECRFATRTDALANVTSRYFVGDGLQQITPMASYVRELIEQQRVSPKVERGDIMIVPADITYQVVNRGKESCSRGSSSLKRPDQTGPMDLWREGSIMGETMITHRMGIASNEASKAIPLAENCRNERGSEKGSVAKICIVSSGLSSLRKLLTRRTHVGTYVPQDSPAVERVLRERGEGLC